MESNTEGRRNISLRKFIMNALILGALLLLCPSAEAWTGKVVKIMDGDTIEVLRDRHPVKIRLYGVDSPERDQDFGSKARQFTAGKVFGKEVEVMEVERDRHGRTVAWVQIDGTSLNKELLEAGLAWWFRRYAPHEKELKEAESRARNLRIGLWSLDDPLPPWKFRRENR